MVTQNITYRIPELDRLSHLTAGRAGAPQAPRTWPAPGKLRARREHSVMDARAASSQRKGRPQGLLPKSSNTLSSPFSLGEAERGCHSLHREGRTKGGGKAFVRLQRYIFSFPVSSGLPFRSVVPPTLSYPGSTLSGLQPTPRPTRRRAPRAPRQTSRTHFLLCVSISESCEAHSLDP